MELQTFDLGKFEGSSEDRLALYDQIREHFATFGFAKFVNHGIQDVVIDKAFQWAEAFFRLSDEIKQTANRPPGPGPNRGYASVGKEKLGGISGYSKGERAPKLVEDIKESFDLGPEHDEIYPTPWPSDHHLPGFRSFMQEFSQECDKVHMRLLDILGQTLGLSDSALLSSCNEKNGELRIAHYPPVAVKRLESGNTFRIAEHTDTGTLTLLFQDSVGGLEIERRNGEGDFMPVTTSRPSEMIVNIGDTLQRWTGGMLRSANHRVLAPQGSNFASDDVLPARFSIGFFGKANPKAPMAPFKEFRLLGGDSFKEDEMLTATEYYAKLQTKTFPGHN